MILSKMWSFILVAFAALMAGLAFLYGKRTPQVMRAQLNAVRARELVLAAELRTVELTARRMVEGTQARKLGVKADFLAAQLFKLRADGARITRDLVPTLGDDALAHLDNSRRHAPN